MCHGKSWQRESYMTDVMEGKFLRNSIEQRILKREDDMHRSSNNFLISNKSNLSILRMKKALNDIQNMSENTYNSQLNSNSRL